MTTPAFRLLGLCLCLALWCGRGRADWHDPLLPADVTLNRDAGRGGLMFVNVRLVDDTVVPMVLDTGSPITLLDKSLEPKLGPRLAAVVLYNFGDKQKAGLYAQPSLRIGRILLLTGTNVVTWDFRRLSKNIGRPVKGILGMDCLRHYCLQADFRARVLRFLDPDRINTAALGRAYPLVYSSQGQTDDGLVRPFVHRDHLFGGQPGNLLIDTGCNIDGGMQPKLFQQALRREKGGGRLPDRILARFRQSLLGIGGGPKLAYFGECDFDGVTYSNLCFRTWSAHLDDPNMLGLAFLARHLLTLDFPQQTMYLIKTSTGPLADEP